VHAIATAVILALIGSNVFAEEQEPSLAGRPLSDVLSVLQSRGLSIVYSDVLVRPDMVVEREPRSSDPRAILREILEPHALQVREGTGGLLFIVPAARQPVFLEEIVVTPSHTRIVAEQPEPRQSLGREEIRQIPHLADDLYRAVKQLPGAAGSDVSATLNIRGGNADEVLVVLDGLELYEPFHLKGFLNVFSTIDSGAVGGVDLMTGGFPAEYGDRMSGVMDITTRAPAKPSATSVALGTLNGRVLTSGISPDDRTDWLVSARGWYPDLLLDQINTDYYDLLAKVQHRIGSRTTVSLNLLAAYDDLGYRDEPEHLRAEETSEHLWLTSRTDWSQALSSRTVLASGDIDRERIGGNVDVEDGALEVADIRGFNFIQLKQDWAFDIRDRQLFKWGIDVKRLSARYDYSRRTDRDSIGIQLRPRGHSYGAYIAERFRVGDSLIAELGLRWDHQFWIEDENQVSPRVNVMYTLGSHSVFRAAWGRYFQSQRLNELQVGDGVTAFSRPEVAEHWLTSFERQFARGFGLRVEVYNKELSQLRPRYENLFSPIDIFPEAEDDRVRVAPKGVTLAAWSCG